MSGENEVRITKNGGRKPMKTALKIGDHVVWEVEARIDGHQRVGRAGLYYGNTARIEQR